MKALLKGTLIEVIVYDFIRKTNGKCECVYADCFISAYDTREEILSSDIEIVKG